MGFDEEAAVYRKLLTDAQNSDIKVKINPRSQAEAAANALLNPANMRSRRATSNVRENTASRTNRLVGVVQKTTPKSKSKAKPIWR